MMKVSCKTFIPPYGFWVSIRPHGDIMSAIAHINPRSMGMNDL
jgi:hypothetical protein